MIDKNVDILLNIHFILRHKAFVTNIGYIILYNNMFSVSKKANFSKNICNFLKKEF